MGLPSLLLTFVRKPHPFPVNDSVQDWEPAIDEESVVMDLSMLDSESLTSDGSHMCKYIDSISNAQQ